MAPLRIIPNPCLRCSTNAQFAEAIQTRIDAYRKTVDDTTKGGDVEALILVLDTVIANYDILNDLAHLDERSYTEFIHAIRHRIEVAIQNTAPTDYTTQFRFEQYNKYMHDSFPMYELLE